MVTEESSVSITLDITHGGRKLALTVAPISPLAHLSAQLATAFDLSPSALKLVIKGKKLQLDPTEQSTACRQIGDMLSDLVGPNVVEAASTGPGAKPIKGLLIGTAARTLEKLHASEALRQKKHEAFLHHQQRAALARPARTGGVHTIGDSANDPARYKFYHLEPFPKNVPQYEKRKAMLERLSEDPAVRDVMKRHRFAVGVLTELHPLLQPTLLGLNTNAGEKVALRLLTNRLDGTRSYNEVRKILLHELAHNVHGNHDNEFKVLNSLLNKEVASFESSPDFEPWDPHSSASSAEEEARAHRLNEAEAQRAFDKLTFELEDMVELRRERAGKAAEERLRQSRSDAGR